MGAFFDLGVNTHIVKQKKEIDHTKSCTKCGLLEQCPTPFMRTMGAGGLKVLFIFDQASRRNTMSGDLQSPYIKRIEKKLGIDFSKDVWSVFGVKCHSRKAPTDTQITSCRRFLYKTIRELNPEIIIPMGTLAIKSLLNHKISGRISNVDREHYIGEQIPDRDLNAWVCPTYDFETCAEDRNGDYEGLMYEHLKAALAMTMEPFPELWDNWESTTDPKKAIEWIEAVGTKEVAFDYETTGIKPHRQGQQIICCSLAYDKKAYSFPYFGENEEFKAVFCKFLAGKSLKIAHKADFEMSWSQNICGVRPKIHWDTCLAAHCINNNKAVGLKFLTYVKLGVIGYDDGIDNFLKLRPGEREKSCNSFNKMLECNPSVLMKYNALDSLYTLQLYYMQKPELKGRFLKGFEFFMETLHSLHSMHEAGFNIDAKQMLENNQIITESMEKLHRRITRCEEFKNYPGELNIDSTTQLNKLFYEILGYPEPEEAKMDVEALQNIDSQFANLIVQYRKLKKIRDTYYAQFKNELVYGPDKIYPFFGIHLAATYRTNSYSVNLQNQSKRDQDAKKYIRSIIKPSPGNMLVEFDYKMIEVCVGCVYHKDPQMMTYVMDETTDMHRDTAMDLFFRDKETFTKDERFCAKNGFVFPSFYGSTYKAIAPNLWKMIPDGTRTHLASNGIRTLLDFSAHVKAIEDKFWNERFPVYKQWKQELWEKYLRLGYIESLDGFKFYGPMSFTELTNRQIQCSASHCVLWTINKIIDKIPQKNCIIGQIHDAIVMDLNPLHEDLVDSLVKQYGTIEIRKEWDWINVPLTIEKEKSEINGNWAEMKGAGKL